MQVSVYLPAVLAVIAVMIAPVLARGVRPRTASWSLTAVAVVAAGATLATLGLVAWMFVSMLQPVAATGRWRTSDVAARSPIPMAVAALGLAVVVVIGVRLGRRLMVVARSARPVVALERSRPSRGRPPQLIVVDDDSVTPHALPGLPGCAGHIIVSRSTMQSLPDPALRRAVLEHERAHLRHRHATLRFLADLAVAVNPLAAGVARRLGQSLERWADEEAAAATSPAIVAEALALCALGSSGSGHLAFGELGVPARLRALLAGSAPSRWRAVPVEALVVAVFVVSVLVTVHACRDVERFFEALRQLAATRSTG